MILRSFRFALVPFALGVTAAACSTGSGESASSNGEEPKTGTVTQSIVASFPAGSLVIPMDTTFQDNGTLKAFGLVYKLLTSNVPVHWIADGGKTSNTGVDFVGSGRDLRTNALVTNHGYRAGPFVIAASERAAALPIIQAWQAANTTTTVHDMTAAFSADDRKVLVAAPRIGVFLDGSENIAFEYLNAAGIPDSTGAAWTKASPDLLTEAAVAGANAGGAFDGVLLNADGTPKYCQLTSMHYNSPGNAESIREVRGWLASSQNTHAFMECAATQTFENSVNGHFLTTKGITNKGPSVNPTRDLHPESLFTQYDGTYTGVGGSVSVINLAQGSSFYSSDVTLVNLLGSASTQNLAWLTGHIDGDVAKGKVSYLVGHNYQTALPISGHPQTNGVRLFLDSLFETECASFASQPTITLTKSAPASVTGNAITYTISYGNSGPGVANTVSIVDPIPTGSTFVSATSGGSFASGKVTWNLGNLSVNETGSVSFTVNVTNDGTYTNQAAIDYVVGVTPKEQKSNQTSTSRNVNTGSDLSVSVTESPNPVAPGGTMTYSVDVANAGPAASGTVTVTDPIPAGSTFTSATGTGWTCAVASGTVTCTHAGLASGGSAPLSIVLAAPTNAGSVSNTVSVSSPTPDPASANNSVTTTTTVQPSSDLSVTMTDSPDPVAAGGALTYTVTARNAGPSTSAAVTFTDTLPAGATFVGATGTGWTCSAAGQTVTCTHAGLASGAQSSLTLDVTAPSTPGSITNTGTIGSATSDPTAANNTVTATTTVGNASSDLAITLTDTPDPVVTGGVISYGVGVSNAGPSPSGTLTITDTLPAGTTYQGATGAGWTCAVAAGTLTCTHAAIASGATAPLSFQLTAPSVAGVVTNTVTVAGVSGDPSSTNNSATATTVVSPPPGADLAVDVTASPNPVGTGGNETYSVNVQNSGPALSGPVVVTDTVPSGAAYAGAAGTGWTCVLAAGTVTCTHAPLASGAAAPLTINLTAPATPGTMSNTVTVSSTSPDPSGANNSVTIDTTVSGAAGSNADLQLTVGASPNPVAGGGTETYTATAKNNGPSTSGPITFTDSLPAGATFTGANGTGWTCTQAGTSVTCTHAALANGASASLTLTVTAPSFSGTMTNSATITSTTTDPDDSDNTVVSSTTVNGTGGGDGGVDGGGGGSDLSISVSASPNPVAPGGTETYTVTASNAGPDPSSAVTVTDTLPAGATYTGASGAGWNCTQAGNTVTCTHAALAAGESSQVQLTIQVPSTPGMISNTTSVSSSSPDPNGANNGVVTVTTVGTTVGDGGACSSDTDCGGANSGQVCDTTTSTCVLGCRGQGGNGCPTGETCTSMDNTIGQCVAGDGGGPCSTDTDCGGANSGLVCDATSSSCVPGCRGQGGNGCPTDQSCTSTDNTIGQCVAGDGGTDGGLSDGGDAGDAGNEDATTGDASTEGGSGTDAAEGTDGGALADEGSLEGGGCNCATTGHGGDADGAASLGALGAIAAFFVRRRKNDRAR